MADRSAPATGYDFGAKRDYRRKVWGALLAPGLPDGYIAMLPSIEGDEVELVLRKGIPVERIVVIDRNPAIAATLSRRFPGVKAYGVDVDRAIERMAQDGVSLAAFNMDLCGPLSRKLLDTVVALLQSGIAVDAARVAITVMKGREGGEAYGRVRAARAVPELVRGRSERAVALQGMLFHACADAAAMRDGILMPAFAIPHYLRDGEYASSRVWMVWAAFELHKRGCLCKRCCCAVACIEAERLVVAAGLASREPGSVDRFIVDNPAVWEEVVECALTETLAIFDQIRRSNGL